MKEHRLIVIQIFACLIIAVFTIYASIEKQNSLTELRVAIPALAKEVRELHEDNIRLQYDIDRFESPEHLMELARKPEFSHLKHPYWPDVLIIEKKP